MLRNQENRMLNVEKYTPLIAKGGMRMRKTPSKMKKHLKGMLSKERRRQTGKTEGRTTKDDRIRTFILIWAGERIYE